METTTPSTSADESIHAADEKETIQGNQTVLVQKITALLNCANGHIATGLHRIATENRTSLEQIMQLADGMRPRQRGRLEHDVDSALHLSAQTAKDALPQSLTWRR